MPSKRRLLKLVLALIGLGLFSYLVWRTGYRRLLDGIAQVGWGLAAVIALGGLSHLLKTWAWRFTFPRSNRPRPRLMYAIRLAGEAVAMMAFAGQVFGEATRAWLLRRTEVPRIHRISSVVIDRGMFIFTGVLIIVTGTLAAPAVVALPAQARRYNLLAMFVFAAFAGLAVLGLRKRVPFASGVLRAAEWIPRLREGARAKREGARQLEAAIYSFLRQRPGDFAASFLLNVSGHFASILEVYIILRMLQLEVTLVEAFVIEALTKVVNFLGVVIPGNVGAYEGGQVVILKLLDLGAANGLTLGVTRRIRMLSWGAAGMVALLAMGFSRKQVLDEKEKEAEEGGITMTLNV